MGVVGQNQVHEASRCVHFTVVRLYYNSTWEKNKQKVLREDQLVDKEKYLDFGQTISPTPDVPYCYWYVLSRHKA